MKFSLFCKPALQSFPRKEYRKEGSSLAGQDDGKIEHLDIEVDVGGSEGTPQAGIAGSSFRGRLKKASRYLRRMEGKRRRRKGRMSSKRMGKQSNKG